MQKKLSIIVPVYNAEQYLAECIDSILAQTYTNLQLILVNDGSTDNSLSLCLKYREADPRVVVLDKANGGVSTARNLGIKSADGDYIGFVDSDDYIAKDMYEKMINQITKDGSEICALTKYTINPFPENHGITVVKALDQAESMELLFRLRFPTSLWAYLYTKEAIKDCYLNEEIHFFEDFEFNFRVLSRVSMVSICDQTLYNYRISETSANQQKINEKRMTCLLIYQSVINKLQDRKLIQSAEYFRAHFLVSVILSMAKSTNINRDYINRSQSTAREMRRQTFSSKMIPTHYKATIIAFSIAPKIFLKMLYLLKYRQ